jgi:WD40 repeat protein
MSETLPPDDGAKQTRLERRMDRICDRFEAAWKAGLRPRIERYLGKMPPSVRPKLFRELLALELEYRQQNGETPAADEYCSRFADYAGLIAAVFNELPPTTPETPHLVPKWTLNRLLSYIQRVAFPEESAPSSPPNLLSTLLALVDEALAQPNGVVEPSRPLAPESQGATKLLRPGQEAVTDTLQDLALPPDETAPQMILGDYEILGQLDQGGMGFIYRARQRSTQRIVALKVIRSDRLEQLRPGERQEWIERFHREGRIAASIDHDHAVTVYDVGESDGKQYYSMRLVEGRNLGAVLGQGPVANRRAALYVELAARALHAFHLRGIIHRDVKPRNILVDAKDRPYITDFGLAKAPAYSRDLTVVGVLGTPEYMSPEQARNPKTVGAAADIYSLGATLYELLTRRPPFQAADPVETLRQVQDEEPVPPRQLNPAIDRDLELICLKCLQKEPHRRYSSAEQLADELQRYLNKEPLIYTRPVGRIERFGRWCRRNPALAKATGLATAFLGLAMGLSIILAIHFFQAAENSRQEQAKTTDALKISRRLSTTLEIERGLHFCVQGDVSRGMLWLARSLYDAPTDADDLRQYIRANLADWSRDMRPLQAILPHQGSVHAAVFSPDGKMILTGSSDKMARLWNVATGKLIGTPFPHPGAVYAVAFSPDGKILLTGSADRTARLWDAATGKPLGSPLPHLGAVNAVAFSPDGKMILTGSGWMLPGKAGDDPAKGEARLWDAATGKLLGSPLLHSGAVYAVAFSPDSRTFVTGSACYPPSKDSSHREGKAQLWDAAAGKLLREMVGPQGLVLAVAFSPDSKTILTGNNAKVACLWNAETGHLLSRLFLPQGAVQAVAFSPDGKAVLTGSRRGEVQLWEAQTGKLIGPSLPHLCGVTTVAFSPDGGTILTGSMDQTVRLWKATTRMPLHKPLPHRQAVRTVAFSSDGKTAVTGSVDRTAQIWDTTTGRPIGQRLQHNGWITAVAFSPNRQMVVTASRDGTACLWDAATGKKLHPLEGHQNWVNAVAFSPDSKRVVTGSSDKTARVWETATGKELYQLHGHQRAIYTVAFSPDGQSILTGSADATAWLWDTGTGKPIRIFHGHQAGVKVVAFSPDSKTMVTGSLDHTAQLWERATGLPMGPLLVHQAAVRAAVFSPDGTIVLTGSEDYTAQLWKVATGKPLGPALQHQDRVPAVAFSPDGKMALTGSWDKTARLWEVATGKPVGPPLQHGSLVEALAFSPNGKTILTGSDDCNGRLWPMPAPLEADADRILLWTQVMTGLELIDGDTLRELDAREWEQRRQYLAQQDGPSLR